MDYRQLAAQRAMTRIPDVGTAALSDADAIQQRMAAEQAGQAGQAAKRKQALSTGGSALGALIGLAAGNPMLGAAIGGAAGKLVDGGPEAAFGSNDVYSIIRAIYAGGN